MENEPKQNPGPLGRMNDSLTAFSAIVTTLGAIAAGIAAMMSNFAKNEATNAKDVATEAKEQSVKTQLALDEVNLKQKNEESNYKYVEAFQQILKAYDLKDDKDHTVLLAVMDIITQASGGNDGKVSSEIKHVLPIKLAQSLNNYQAISEMDPELRYLKYWLPKAKQDSNNVFRVEALKALCAVCRNKSESAPDVAVTAIESASELLACIEADLSNSIPNYNVLISQGTAALVLKGDLPTPDNNHMNALRELSALYRFLDSKAAWPIKAREDNPDDIRLYGMNLLTDITHTAERLTQKPTNVVAKKDSSEAEKKFAMEVDNFKLYAEEKRGSQNQTDTDPQRIVKLIADLTDERSEVRRAARAGLGLIGQNAVKPLMDEIIARRGQNGEADYRTRLGVATALLQMKQPVTLSPEQVGLVVELLRSNDSETRLITADFLINLESIPAIYETYNTLKNSVEDEALNPDKDGAFVMNAVTIVAAWSTALHKDTPGTVAGIPMIKQALHTAIHLKKIFENRKNSENWQKVIDRLAEMIKRAHEVKVAAGNKNRPG